VIKESSIIAFKCSVNDKVIVKSEHVAVSKTSLLIVLLSQVCDLVPHNLSNVLAHDVSLVDVLHGKEAEFMDLRWHDLDSVLSRLEV
jgi:hypothetical protein